MKYEIESYARGTHIGEDRMIKDHIFEQDTTGARHQGQCKCGGMYSEHEERDFGSQLYVLRQAITKGAPGATGEGGELLAPRAIEHALAAAKANGYVLYGIQPFENPKDEHLCKVMAFDGEKFVLWTFNRYDGGFHNGRYYTTWAEAHEEFVYWPGENRREERRRG